MARRRLVQASLAVAGLALCAATIVPTVTHGDTAMSIDDMVPELRTKQSDADRVPSKVDLESLGDVIPDSTRLLASTGNADFWVAKSGASTVCLIVYIPRGSEVSAASCSTYAAFYNRGLSIGAGESSDRSAEAYLLPADVDRSALVERAGISAARSSNSQLIVVDGPQKIDRTRTVSIARQGRDFRFAPLQGRR